MKSLSSSSQQLVGMVLPWLLGWKDPHAPRCDRNHPGLVSRKVQAEPSTGSHRKGCLTAQPPAQGAGSGDRGSWKPAQPGELWGEAGLPEQGCARDSSSRSLHLPGRVNTGRGAGQGHSWCAVPGASRLCHAAEVTHFICKQRLRATDLFWWSLVNVWPDGCLQG